MVEKCPTPPRGQGLFKYSFGGGQGWGGCNITLQFSDRLQADKDPCMELYRNHKAKSGLLKQAKEKRPHHSGPINVSAEMLFLLLY